MQFKPTVILLDGAFLGGHRGLSRISAIVELAPQSRVILMTPKPNDREGIAALRLGVKGYCSEALPRSLMPRLIDRVSDGEVWIGRKLLAAVVDEAGTVMRNRTVPSPGLPRHTPRERQIGELLAMGATNKEIALRLNLSEKTVKGHLTALFRKLGVASRLRLGLLLAQLGSSSRRDSRDETQLKSMGQEKTLPSR